MRKYKDLIYYVVVVGLLCIITYFILAYGQQNLEVHKIIDESAETNLSAWDGFFDSVVGEATGATALLLLQIIVILFSVRFFGWICQKIGQPTVVGEIIAGIVLGASVLGTYLPEVSEIIFPESSIGNIKLLSEIGLVLFMFIVGIELDPKTLKNKANTALLISHTCIALPFALGIGLSYFIYPYFTHPDSRFVPFALFMGIAMSITAFPVLARIVHERGLNKTMLGGMAITCAAIDDVTAWCLLAAVIAIAKAGTFTSSLYVILFSVIYIVFMFKLVRPFLKRIADIQTSKKIISKSVVGIFFLVLFGSAYLTSVIGIHALFGAFVAGVIMPTNVNFRKLFIEKIEDIALILFLPLFFVNTGLNTKIGLLNNGTLWLICLGIILIATTGKLIGGALMSRFTGMDWKSSLILGTLMNTRGLMELVVLNIGLELGILTSEVFAMMVVMALVTTFMTSPLLNLIDRVFKNKSLGDAVPERKKFKMLVFFEDSELGKKLLIIANAFVRKSQTHSIVDMVHISEGSNLYQYNMDEEETDLFTPVLQKSEEIAQPITPIFEISSDPYSRIVKMGNSNDYDLILLGAHASMYKGNLLGRFLGFSNKILHLPTLLIPWVTRRQKVSDAGSVSLDEGSRLVFTKSDIPVALFVDKGLDTLKNVFVPILDEEDIFVGNFMERLVINSYTRITLWDSIGLLDKSIEFTKCVRSMKAVNPYLFQLWNNNIALDLDILKKQDLIMVSVRSWKKLKETHPEWIKSLPSTLVLNE